MDFQEEDELTQEPVEEKTEPVKAARGSTGFQYRVVCPACTGIAYYAEDVYREHPADICHNCGSALGVVNEQDFIPLTDSEKRSLEALA